MTLLIQMIVTARMDATFENSASHFIGAVFVQCQVSMTSATFLLIAEGVLS